MYNCPLTLCTIVDEMSVDEMSVDEMSVDELSWNQLSCARRPVHATVNNL